MNFEYTQRNVPGLSIVDLEDFEYDLEGCKCEGECRPSTSEDSLGLYGTQNYDADGRLLLESNSVVPILECHENCSCSKKCGNRAAQFGLQFKVEVGKNTNESALSSQPFLSTNGKGIGLRALESIERGRFLIEYSGEIISAIEAKKRSMEYKSTDQQHHYIFTLNEHTGDECHQTFIDATKFGNLARFCNHSCDPNLQPMILRYGRSIPVMALFACRDIQVGDELAYDYGKLTANRSNLQDGKPCRCDASNCRGFLPTADYVVEKE
ncbi:hypothetical protein M3Y98_00784000 [Aphelenchoides besseyi]|nr:hypothetical protein M3Y98_00784000 [Aphelenchoides besseyi]